jgi:hypothetical protein
MIVWLAVPLLEQADLGQELGARKVLRRRRPIGRLESILRHDLD